MRASRRDFIRITTLGGSALALGFTPYVLGQTETPVPFQPNGWVKIEPDGVVTLTIGKCEMGQGVRTSLAMILADELDADWARVRIVQAMPSQQFRSLGTGGSFSVRAMWTPLRTAAAAAREMLTGAGAARLGVDPASLRTENGFVIHDASNRRVAYAALTGDAAKLAVPQQPKLKPNADFRLIGKRTARIDGQNIVTGKAVYGLDARVPGMLFATMVRPRTLGGTIKSFDAAKAKQVAGVVDVVQISRGVAVVARDSWAALQGREALAVEFDDSANANYSSAGYIASLSAAAGKDGIVTRKEGDVAAALTTAAKTIEADYVYPFYAHAPVEPMNTAAWLHDGICEIWSSTQAPNDVQQHAATLLSLPPEKVQVNVTLVGGGFGRRLGWDYALDAVELAKKIEGRPVQLFWTRADDMRYGYFQAASVHRMRAALDANNVPTAWTHKKVSTYHNARRGRPTPQQILEPDFNRGSSWGVYDVAYTIPSIETQYVFVDTPVPIGPWRAVFAPSSVFARECFFDELAHAAGKDPLQFRLELLPSTVLEVGRLKIDRAITRNVINVAREKSGWDKPLPKGRGRGLAVDVYDGVTHVAYVAEVTGTRVDRVICVIDCGLVVNPNGVEQQVEGGVIWGLSSALHGEITVRDGAIEQSSYDDFPVLRMRDTPRIETYIVPSDRGPFGVGEPTVSPVAPAVVNAIFAATGRRIRRLPLSSRA